MSLSKYPPAVGYQTDGLDNKGRSKRILLLRRARGFPVCNYIGMAREA